MYVGYYAETWNTSVYWHRGLLSFDVMHADSGGFICFYEYHSFDTIIFLSKKKSILSIKHTSIIVHVRRVPAKQNTLKVKITKQWSGEKGRKSDSHNKYNYIFDRMRWNNNDSVFISFLARRHFQAKLSNSQSQLDVFIDMPLFHSTPCHCLRVCAISHEHFFSLQYFIEFPLVIDIGVMTRLRLTCLDFALSRFFFAPFNTLSRYECRNCVWKWWNIFEICNFSTLVCNWNETYPRT